MESSISHEVKVGIFTLVGVVLFLVSVILLGGDQLFFTRTYTLKLHLPQVQGLGRGSVVSLVGVPVGNVDMVTFVRGSTDVEVTMRIDREVQKRITEGSRASIKTQGALGDKYIYIEPGPTGAKPLKNGGLLEASDTKDLIDIISSKGAELGEVVDVIKEVHKLFATINGDGRSQKLVDNLVASSENLNKFLSEGRETFKAMRTEAIAPMSSVMKKIDRGQGTLGALINDPSLHNRLSRLLGASPRNQFLKPIIRDSIQTHEKSDGHR